MIQAIICLIHQFFFASIVLYILTFVQIGLQTGHVADGVSVLVTGSGFEFP